jgi:hypothetical protein
MCCRSDRKLEEEANMFKYLFLPMVVDTVMSFCALLQIYLLPRMYSLYPSLEYSMGVVTVLGMVAPEGTANDVQYFRKASTVLGIALLCEGEPRTHPAWHSTDPNPLNQKKLAMESLLGSYFAVRESSLWTFWSCDGVLCKYSSLSHQERPNATAPRNKP